MSSEFEANLQNKLRSFLEVSNGDAHLEDNVLILCHLHCFDTTVSLFRQLMALGVPPSSVHVFPKPYSNVAGAADQLRELGIVVFTPETVTIRAGRYDQYISNELARFCLDLKETAAAKQRVVLLDDGGQLSVAAEYVFGASGPPVVSVQTTASGLNVAGDLPFALVSVATAAIKYEIEYPEIVEAAFARLSKGGFMEGARTVGILGFGKMGRAVARHSNRCGFDVKAFDTRNEIVPDAYKITSRFELIPACDLIFGCSGEDSSSTLAFIEGRSQPSSALPEHAVSLVSLSSRDVEFASILLRSGRDLNLSQVDYPTVSLELPIQGRSACTVRVLNAGFPYNFDRVREWERSDRILVTRCLQGCGLLQALLKFEGLSGDQLQDRWVAALEQVGLGSKAKSE